MPRAEQGWVTDRPKPDRWRLVKLVDGSTITGATIFFRSSGQWRMEVEFPRGP